MTLGRLARSVDVRRTLRAGRRRSGALCGLHVLDRPDGRGEDRPEGPRMTAVASRRVGDAVRRNRAKRLLREAARTLPWRSVDVVLVARAATPAATMPAVRTELAAHAAALGALATDAPASSGAATAARSGVGTSGGGRR